MKTNMFTDWKKMNINEGLLNILKNRISSRFNDAVGGGDNFELPQGFRDDGEDKIVLVNQPCWNKITYSFG